MTHRPTPDLPPILAFEEIDSTNAEARRRVEGGERGPLWITSSRQTAGRGRRGRAWDTGAGANLAATLLITTDKPPIEAAQVAFVAALAVFDLAHAFVAPSLLSLKWPNDTLLAGRKLSGVLVESGGLGQGLWLAVGIGVNLAEAPQGAERPATTLAEHMSGPPPTPREALEVLRSAVETWRNLWADHGFAPIARAWMERAHGLGAACIARLESESVSGVAEGLDPDGALRLRLADGSVRRISAGDVFFA